MSGLKSRRSRMEAAPPQLSPTPLPSRRTTPAPCGQRWNVGPAQRLQRTVLDDAPTPTDLKVAVPPVVLDDDAADLEQWSGQRWLARGLHLARAVAGAGEQPPGGVPRHLQASGRVGGPAFIQIPSSCGPGQRPPEPWIGQRAPHGAESQRPALQPANRPERAVLADALGAEHDQHTTHIRHTGTRHHLRSSDRNAWLTPAGDVRDCPG